jgi:hypothetical protein
MFNPPPTIGSPADTTGTETPDPAAASGTGLAFGWTLALAAALVLALVIQVLPQAVAASEGVSTPADTVGAAERSYSALQAAIADGGDQSSSRLQTCSWTVFETYDDYVESYHLYRLPSSERPGPWIAVECENLPPHMDVGLPRPNNHFAGWAADESPPDWLVDLFSR